MAFPFKQSTWIRQLKASFVRSDCPLSAALSSFRYSRYIHPSGSESIGCGRSILPRAATKYDRVALYGYLQLSVLGSTTPLSVCTAVQHRVSSGQPDRFTGFSNQRFAKGHVWFNRVSGRGATACRLPWAAGGRRRGVFSEAWGGGRSFRATPVSLHVDCFRLGETGFSSGSIGFTRG